MKIQRRECLINGMTLIEVIVVIAICFLLFMMFHVGRDSGARSEAQLITCTSNLKQTGLALKNWSGDHGDKYPMDVSTTNGGTMELAGTPYEWKVFLAMSNELGTPRILNCPADKSHPDANQFASGFGRTNISYFFNTGSYGQDPQTIVSGDDNFLVGGVPVKPGVLIFGSNSPVTWDAIRHHKSGNTLLADGSVQGATSSTLSNYLSQSSSTTNRFTIP
jgi:hypothetical protein